MMKSVVGALVCGAGILAMGHASTALAEPKKFNGTWNVHLVTESGICDSSYSYAVAIQDGQVSLASGGAGSVNGRVGPDGTVGLSVSNGTASGAASGRLSTRSGSGTWKVASLCSGSWTAQRRSTVTAQAF